MSLIETYFDINNEILNAKNREEIDDVIKKINALNPLVLANVETPSGWNTLKEKDLKIEKFKDLLSFSVLTYLQRIPNYNEIKNIYDLIQESKKIDKNAPNQTSPYLAKVNVAVGKEIDFPSSVLNTLNKEKSTSFNGIHCCKTTAQDFDGVVIRLENYFSKLITPKKDNKDRKETEKTVVNVTQINQNDIRLNIDISINNVLNEIENDDDLSEKEIADCKEQMEILKNCVNERPKTKWEKCKKVLAWLGDKTIKFGKWFIPIIKDILIAKYTMPTA